MPCNAAAYSARANGDAYKSGPRPSLSSHSSKSHIRTRGAIAGTELVRWFMESSQAALSGSVQVQPLGLKVTIEPSACRQMS